MILSWRSMLVTFFRGKIMGFPWFSHFGGALCRILGLSILIQPCFQHPMDPSQSLEGHKTTPALWSAGSLRHSNPTWNRRRKEQFPRPFRQIGSSGWEGSRGKWCNPIESPLEDWNSGQPAVLILFCEVFFACGMPILIFIVKENKGWICGVFFSPSEFQDSYW